jgi:hypothetical protein
MHGILKVYICVKTHELKKPLAAVTTQDRQTDNVRIT